MVLSANSRPCLILLIILESFITVFILLWLLYLFFQNLSNFRCDNFTTYGDHIVVLLLALFRLFLRRRFLLWFQIECLGDFVQPLDTDEAVVRAIILKDLFDVSFVICCFHSDFFEELSELSLAESLLVVFGTFGKDLFGFLWSL